jgi:hypothetical protein
MRDLRRLGESVERLDAFRERTAERLHRLERRSEQLTAIAARDLRERPLLARLPHVLDEPRIADHVRRAVAAAPLVTEPYEHVIVDRVLPGDVYELLVQALPPEAFFDDRDPIKQDLTFPMACGPALSVGVWEYVDQVIAPRVIRPAVLNRFAEPLRRHFEGMFGSDMAERALTLPHSVHGGRLMLRRPGYHLAPHRDPKRALLTCLMYLAREGDSEVYGTQLYRVVDDGEARYKQTYYPEQDGRPCELVATVPFRPNTMLVSLNARGAHGAAIPADAPAALERYTYQFYVAPDNAALAALLKSLPAERRVLWQNKASAMAGGGTAR